MVGRSNLPPRNQPFFLGCSLFCWRIRWCFNGYPVDAVSCEPSPLSRSDDIGKMGMLIPVFKCLDFSLRWPFLKGFYHGLKISPWNKKHFKVGNMLETLFSNSNGQANRSNLVDFEPGIFCKLAYLYIGIGMSRFFHPQKWGKTRSKFENNDISKDTTKTTPSKILGTWNFLNHG